MKTEIGKIRHKLSSLSSYDLETTALEVFRWQARECPVYARYLDLLGTDPAGVSRLEDVPFLPIEMFRKKTVLSGPGEMPELWFESSGTTGAETSKHYVRDAELYRECSRKAFELRYGSLEGYCILALLPHYLQQEHSSLVYMVRHFMDCSGHPGNGFYLYQHAELFEQLKKLKASGQKTLLIGVTYALLDFVENYAMDFPELILMETGGMKGKRKELSRDELHAVLKPAFGLEAIHSEYGMTELLSQAYSVSGNRFYGPPWMKILIRDASNPARMRGEGETGGINVIDLANLYSCAFLELQDVGFLYDDGSFAVCGRVSNSPVRGCNLMVE